jgi:3-deoxy-manno-octulosonate cytidylyltransferase (CMP-KDO synthetase)
MPWPRCKAPRLLQLLPRREACHALHRRHPARFGSSRLPGKPLADILGKPMIQHVHERVKGLQELADVVVATDDKRIVDAVTAFGGKALLTSPDHPSGTDRLREVMRHHPADLYLNVQGDEPW